MDDTVEELQRKVIILEAQMEFILSRLDQLEKPHSTGRKISLMPVAISGIHPISLQDGYMLLAVPIEKTDVRAPVIKVARTFINMILKKPIGATARFDDYVQTEHVAQKHFLPGNHYEWRIIA